MCSAWSRSSLTSETFRRTRGPMGKTGRVLGPTERLRFESATPQLPPDSLALSNMERPYADEDERRNDENADDDHFHGAPVGDGKPKGDSQERERRDSPPGDQELLAPMRGGHRSRLPKL